MAQSRFLERNAREINADFIKLGAPDFWALSVACRPGWTIQQVAARSGYDGDRMMISTVGRLRSGGFEVVPDRGEGPAHALLILGQPPAEPLWAVLRTFFDGPYNIDARLDERR